MMLLAFLCGAATVLCSIALAVRLLQPSETQAPPSFPSLFSRRQRKTPKAISEEELWRREQKEPPKDPGH